MTVIPDAMRQADQWICWTHEDRGEDDELTKVPRAPWSVDHTGPASAKDPDNMAPFEEAKDWADKHPDWHLGFCFREEGPFVGVDLDKCADPETGDVDKFAYSILRELDSFTEVSPSGTGLHVICYGELDDPVKNSEAGVEMYDRERFFTVTGDHFEGSPETINQRDGALAEVADEYRPETQPGEQSEVPSREESPKEVGNFGSDHPFYNIRVSDMYPSLPVDENCPHPEHSSKTGANFKIHRGGQTAICWHADHADPSNGAGGVGIAAPHLLAMRATGLTHCYNVKRNFRADDELAFKAWKQAVDEGYIRPDPPIWRAIRHITDKHGLADPSVGGSGGWASYRAACRIIRHEHDYDITLDDPT